MPAPNFHDHKYSDDYYSILRTVSVVCEGNRRVASLSMVQNHGNEELLD